MQFSRERPHANTITRYDAQSVWIGGEAVHGSVAVSTEALLTDWDCASIDQLDAATLAPLIALAPEVIVLGVGNAVRFPDGAVLREVMQQGIGIEVMNDGAAVRTFNVMLSEGRDVVLAMLR